MSKTAALLLSVCLFLLPASAFASVTVTPGFAGENMSPGDKQDVFIRLNTLERAVIELQNENAQLKQQLSGEDEAAPLAARVTALEVKFSGLQTLLMQIVAMLTQLLTR